MMKSRLPLLLSLVAAPSVAQQPAARAATQVVPLDKLVAIVGDQPITMFDLQERMLQDAQASGQPLPSDTVQLVAMEKQTLGLMIDEELLLAKAKELKIEVPDADVNNTVNQQMKDVRSRFSSDAEFRAALAKAGLGTPDEWKRFLTEQVKRQQMLERVTRKLHDDGKIVPANVSEQEVAEAFAKNRDKLPKREAAVTFRQIVVAPKPTEAQKAVARAKAESLLVELNKGADFAQLAKRESMDPGSKELGGDLGWQRMGQFVPEFDRWVFGPYALRPGQLSPVVETPFGFHIIRVDRINGPQVQARHILIRPAIDSADIARAKAEADTVLTQLRAGVNFDTLARKHHDFASKEETALLTPFPRAQLPEAYQKAFTGRKPGDILSFQIPGTVPGVPKFVIANLITVDEGGDRTLDEMRLMIRDRLAEEGGVRRYLDALRKQTYVSVRLDEPTRTSAR